LKSEKKKSLKKTLQISFMILIGITLIPTAYSIIVSQMHTKQYDNIITNVSTANRINQIAKTDIPNELWEIVCGKKDFMKGEQYYQVRAIFKGIDEMMSNTKSPENKAKLEVAFRACTTLSKNIQQLQDQMESGSSVTDNEAALDEIRTISSLFSDIMQDFILSEIESANETNTSISTSSIILTMIQTIILLICFSISISSYFSVSKAINEPLSDMQKLSTQIAEGDLKARTQIPEVIELAPLAENMNTMAEQIEVLIQKNVEEQSNFQKAEMKALQAQITPHFLYNTFDTIIWLAEEEKTDDVVKITKAFSDFLRISLSKGHEWITVQQELDHIKNYLTIQEIRYADILNYEIIADESLMNCKTIKLVLQPLVENAIYHGIKNKRGRGHLTVRISHLAETNSILFEVTDDGAGFTPERLAQVNMEMASDSSDTEKLTSVYGLYNVNKKLKLYYGKDTEGLKIVSEHNKGTSISFVIPCILGE